MMDKISAGLVGTLLDPKRWYPSPDRRISPTPWFLPLAQMAFIVSTMLPREARIKIAIPALLILVSQTRSVSTGDVNRDFGRAAFIFGFLLKFIDFGLLVKDGEVYKLKDRKETTAQLKGFENGKDDSSSMRAEEKKSGIWQGFKDSSELWLFTMRGIGWNWEVGGIPEREPQSTG